MSSANLLVLDVLYWSSRLSLAHWSTKHDLDPNPQLPRLAVGTGQVEEIMTQLSAWLLGSGFRENPGKNYFQTYLPSVWLERELLAEASATLPGDDSNYQDGLDLGHLGDLFSGMFLLLHCGTRSPLNLTLTQKNEELSTRNTSSLAMLLLHNLMDSFFNRAEFLPHIRDDWRQGKILLWKMGVFSQANRNLKGDLIRVLAWSSEWSNEFQVRAPDSMRCRVRHQASRSLSPNPSH